MGVRGDLRLLHQAITKRWLTDDLKELAVEACRMGLASRDPRAQQSALRNLIAMEQQNQKDEHLEANEFRNRVLELASRLGIAGVTDTASGGAIEGFAIPARSDED